MSVGTDTAELKRLFEEKPLFRAAGEDALSIRQGLIKNPRVESFDYISREMGNPRIKITNPLEITGRIKEFWNTYSPFEQASVNYYPDDSIDRAWDWLVNLPGKKIQVGDEIITVPFDTRRSHMGNR